MKFHLRKLLIVCACLLVFTAGAEAKDYLYSKEKLSGRILVPAEPGPEIQLAANELTEHLHAIGNATFAVETDPGGALPSNTIRLAIAANAPKVLPRDGSEQAFVIDQRGKGLLIEGNSSIAVLYGVYEYLQGLGVRWFSPGEIGTVIPHLAEVALDGTRREVRPVFRGRQTDFNNGLDTHLNPDNIAVQERDYDLWTLRNRLQFYRPVHASKYHILPRPIGYGHEDCGHNIRRAALSVTEVTNNGRKRFVPVDITKESERYPLVTQNGKKERSNKGQICFTNPANIERAVQWALEFFQDNPDKVTASMSLQDTGGICECENCTRANGGINPAVDPNRVVWLFMNEVANRIHQVRPDRGIGFLSAYGVMTMPPADIKAAPNIVGMVCHFDHNNHDLDDPTDAYNRVFLQRIKALRDTGAELAAYDYSTFSLSLQPLAILNNVKQYAKEGFVWYHSESMARSEHHNMMMWAQAQLAWDPNQDPRKLIEEYCLTYYGKAGPDVLAVVDAVEASVRKVPKITLSGYGANQEILTDALINFGHQRLQQAASKVTGTEAERVQRFRDTFEIFSLLAQGTRAYYLALDEQSDARRLESVAKFDEAISYWNAHNLKETCSPMMLAGQIERFRKTAVLPLFAINPAPTAALANAGEAQLKSGLFSDGSMPTELPNLVFLPQQWHFRVDPLRQGEGAGWEKTDYDDSRWPLLGYNFFDDSGFPRYEGTFWYRTAFDVPATLQGKRIMMRFGALDDDGKIYINGKLAYIRDHIGPFDWESPFEFDATPYLHPGERNAVAICGRNDYGKGGLWKPVAIYAP